MRFAKRCSGGLVILDRHGFARQVGLSTIGLIVTKAAAAGGGIIVARLLGPADKGIHALFVVAVGLAGIVGTCGLEYWLARNVAETGSRAAARPIIARHLRVTGVLGVVAVSVLMVGAIFGPVPRSAVVAIPFTWVTVFTMVHLAVLGGERRMARVAVATSVGAILYLLAVLALFQVDAASVTLVLAAATVSTLVAGIIAASGVRACLERPAVAVSGRIALRFGAPLAASEVVTFAAQRTDLLVLGVLATSTDLGRYAVALTLVELLLIVPNGVSQVLLPHVAADQNQRPTATLIRIATAALAGPVAVLLVVGDAVVGAVFGDGFRSGSLLLPLLAFGTIPLAAWKLLVADLVGRGLISVRLRSAAAGFFVGAAACVGLVPSLGPNGAALGSGAGSLAAFAVALRTWRIEGGGGAVTLFVLQRSDIAAVRRGIREAVGRGGDVEVSFR